MQNKNAKQVLNILEVGSITPSTGPSFTSLSSSHANAQEGLGTELGPRHLPNRHWVLNLRISLWHVLLFVLFDFFLLK